MKAIGGKAFLLFVLAVVLATGCKNPAHNQVALVGRLTILGEAAVGEVLTAHVNTMNGAEDAGPYFRWREEGSPAVIAEGKTYVPTDADIGKVLTVSAWRPKYAGEVTSKPSQAVRIWEFTISSLAVIPAGATVGRGESFRFVAQVFGENEPPQAVNWEIVGYKHQNTSINGDGVLSCEMANRRDQPETGHDD